MWVIFILGHFITYLSLIRGDIRVCISSVAFRSMTIGSAALSTHKANSHLNCAVGCVTDTLCVVYVFSPLHRECRRFSRTLHHYKNNITNAEKEPGTFVVQMCGDVTDSGGSSSIAVSSVTSFPSSKSVLTGKVRFSPASVSAQTPSSSRQVGKSTKLRSKTGRHSGHCENDRDCKVSGEVCESGICLCKLGFYFNPRNNTCVSSCDVYDKWMNTYKGVGTNDIADYRVYGLYRKGCHARCVKEKKFVCVTAQWGEQYILGRVCQLSRLGYLEVPKGDRIKAKKGFSFAQRTRCK